MMVAPYHLTSRDEHTTDTVVHIGPVSIGASEPVLIAGLDLIEDRAQLGIAAQAVRSAGGALLHGGHYRLRASSHGQHGLDWYGLELLAEAGVAVGLPVAAEVAEPGLVQWVSDYADVLLIASHNMTNTALLKAVGRVDRPVVLKRAIGATVDEWLRAAELILAEGNQRIILCERGVSSIDRRHLPHLLDLAVVPLLSTLTHLPVIVAPSRALGRRDLIDPIACAAVAAGAAGVMIDIHPNPSGARPAAQAIPCAELPALAARLRTIALARTSEPA